MNTSVVQDQGARPTESWKRWMKACFKNMPKSMRLVLYRKLAKVPAVNKSLELKIAQSSQELEGCFALLHGAYVEAGFMKADPSGLRVTPYHALPTTTTLCAKVSGQVVGTVSIVREGVFGLPMGQAFDLSAVREKGGNIAEISSLAIHPSWRKTSGMVLFPLMKFLYEYCVEMFDTKHLAIAVNPDRIELYEALLGFERLPGGLVDSYGFANGAPAVGATLDLRMADEKLKRLYQGSSSKNNLHAYMTSGRDGSIEHPTRRYFVTNDPVMTPDLLREFFEERTSVFAMLDARRKALLGAIYQAPAFDGILPKPNPSLLGGARVRKHPRFTLSAPALARSNQVNWPMRVIEASLNGFMARCEGRSAPPEGFDGEIDVEISDGQFLKLRARCMRMSFKGGASDMSFVIDSSCQEWKDCVAVLEESETGAGMLASIH